MSEFPENITREHLLQAITRIDQEGITGHIQLSTYDVLYDGKPYPPKLLVSWANIFANGEELDQKSFIAGKNSDCFNLLEREGFTIYELEDDTALYELWDQCLEAWPESRVSTMSLSEYTAIGDQNSFCYWIEARLEKLGSIWGGNSFKFGVYERGDKTPKPVHKRYTFTDDYAWDSKFGNSAAQAFEQVKQHILTVIRSIKAKDLQTIEDLPLWPVFKWKIAFLYQDRNEPMLPAVFKPEMLAAFLGTDGGSQGTPLPALYHWVMKERSEKDILGFSRDIWTKANCVLDQQKFKPSDAEQILRERYEAIGDGTDKVIGFVNESGRTIALNRKPKSVRLTMEPCALHTKHAKLIIQYSKNDTRHSNFTKQAPKVASGNEAVLVECSTKQSFNKLLDEYEMVDMKETGSQSVEPEDPTSDINQPLNQILYGPPGTGKTFHTINKALEILSPQFLSANYNDRKKIKAGYDEFVLQGRIHFVTFHQSFSYEDFVEGIRANTADGTVSYAVEPGIFKSACIAANKDVSKKLDALDQAIMELVDSCEQAGGRLDLTTVRGKPFAIEYSGGETFKLYPEATKSENAKYFASIANVKKLYTTGSKKGIYNQSYVEGFLLYLKKHFGLPDYESTEAKATPAEPVVLIIDEINRGNISSIFGELITLIEPSKRAGAEEALSLTLPYSKESFQVPNNLYLIGTMNTADRSLALMDTALRRRFDFIEMMPNVELLDGVEVKGIDIVKMLTVMNKRIEVLYDRDHTLGHAFFMPLMTEQDEEQRFELLQAIFANKILPLLEEYFFEDWAKIRLVLGDDNKEPTCQFIAESSADYDIETLFGKNAQLDYGTEKNKLYSRNKEALSLVVSYTGIYEN